MWRRGKGRRVAGVAKRGPCPAVSSCFMWWFWRCSQERAWSCLVAANSYAARWSGQVYLAIPRTGPGFGPGLAKPDAKKPGPGPARPDQRACFLGPSPARTPKSPSGFGPARPDLQESTKTMGPGPARPGLRAQNLGPSPARGQRRAGPGRAFSGRVGSGRPGRAAHGQDYSLPSSLLIRFLRHWRNQGL